MEAYILDDKLRRIEIVEQYESFVWTERYVSRGDFVLDVPPNISESRYLTKGTLLACDKSDRVMVIKSVENSVSAEGVRLLKVTGPSLETVLDERPNRYTELLAGTTNDGHPLILGGSGGVGGAGATPAAIARQLFSDICITNTAFGNADRIPNIQAGAYYSTVGAIPEPTDTPVMQTEIDTLYGTIKNICDTYRLGFRLVRIEDAVPSNPAMLYFEVYTGFDRTSGQSALPAVIFSSALDNLTDTSDFSSIAGLKNVAYVFAPNGSRVVYGEGVSTAISGFDKKVLIVNASDITDAAGAGLNAKLDQRGMEELAKYRVIVGFDGQIPQDSSLIYGVHYKLGDLVEQRSDTGALNIMKVTEQIFTSDKEGEKSYPTLTVDKLVVPGSWDAMLASIHWDDTTGTWDSM